MRECAPATDVLNDKAELLYAHSEKEEEIITGKPNCDPISILMKKNYFFKFKSLIKRGGLKK